ncbi:uncharacterized protein LOC112596502, partial [Melanaphis sacchari]|uniref:uncharacterized protein LOC112596502 n=1 Tax=Melanaphis sacchari TaxID=742174 RepID=UPI000DC14FE0
MLDNVRLLCREFDSLAYIWTSNNKIDGAKIIVELISHDKLDMHLILEMNSSYIRLNNLKPNTEYAARFRKLVNGTTYHIMDTPIYKTLDDGKILGSVHTIKISNFTVAINSTINMTLAWTPSNDMNCRHKIVYHPNDLSERLKSHIVDIRESNSVKLNSLTVDMEYTVFVQSYYRNKSLIVTGNPVEFKFTTPSCQEINKFNMLDLCPPGKPFDVKLSEALSTRSSTHEGSSRYDVRVHWKSPNTGGRGVDYFRVKLDNEAKNVS